MVDSALDVAVELVRDRASLARISAQWEELARHALEPSPFHDPATTLALLETAPGGGFRCVLSWARDPERSDLPATLGGLFPLRRERRPWGFASWIVHAPLVSAERAQRHLAALLDWLKRSGTPVVEFRQVPRDGRLNEALAEVLREHRAAVYACDVAAPGGAGLGLRDLVIGLGAFGGARISMLPMLGRAKRRIAAAASRAQSPAVAA